VDSKIVRDLMVPLSDYATVPEDATLIEAVKTLKKAQKEFDQSRDRHRAILVYDKNNKIVGKVSQLDVLRALEPKYDQMGEGNPLARYGLSRFGFSPRFMKTMMKQFQLWEKSMEESCKAAAKLKVKDVMYAPTEGEYVEDASNLSVAIHQLLLGHHQSLLVTHDKEIVGILRLTDVFREVVNVFESLES
jgi:CBS domain-containing protein